MSETETDTPTDDLVLEYELDAPVEKVWRALSIPEFRAKWLPTEDLVESEPVSSVPSEEVRYKMREDEPPFLESTVTFQVLPNAVGGTRLRIIHGPVDARLRRQPPRAANSNWPCLMRAA
jgi:uncharacterized protein YndB with AHSA1/START domain